MAVNIYGGGANTNFFGLQFEQETSLEEALNAAGYTVRSGRLLLGNEVIAHIGSKHEFKKAILDPLGIHMQSILSKQLLPDDALHNLKNQTIYIIEKKFQHCAGSVDEKLQTCDFKKKQYEKLFSPKGIHVKYCYICNNWFQRDSYADVRKYINSVGCYLFFNEIPLEFLELA